jgi:hypothetical protein
MAYCFRGLNELPFLEARPAPRVVLDNDSTEVCTGKSDNALTPGRKVFLEL